VDDCDVIHGGRSLTQFQAGLSFDGSQGPQRDVASRMGHRDQPGLHRVLKMVMTASHSNPLPAVSFKCPDQIPTVHSKICENYRDVVDFRDIAHSNRKVGSSRLEIGQLLWYNNVSWLDSCLIGFKMFFLLIVFIARLCRGFLILSRNSRLRGINGKMNSRLGRHGNWPQSFEPLSVFGGEIGAGGPDSTKFPVIREKPGIGRRGVSRQTEKYLAWGW
jgi:hypothetical protein